MFRLVVLSLLVALAVGASPRIRTRRPMLDGRIVGGKDAKIEDYPYQVSMQNWGSHSCGASILSKNIVLTAAHCTISASASRLRIRVGSDYHASGGQLIQVAAIYNHPDYDSWNIDYDVSILKLETDLTFGSGMQPIGLHGENEALDDGELATVTGWGTTASGGSLPSVLQSVEVAKYNDQACNSAYGGGISARMVCHGFAEGGKDSCQGDSGGPLVARGVQVGIVSWGRGCASRGYPGVYTRVANSAIIGHIRKYL